MDHMTTEVFHKMEAIHGSHEYRSVSHQMNHINAELFKRQRVTMCNNKE